MIMDELLKILNTVRENKGLSALAEVRPEMRLREEGVPPPKIGFGSRCSRHAFVPGN